MTSPWDLTEAQRLQIREAHAEEKRREMTMTDTSPAEDLRAAAKLMRERAEAASAGPWFSWQEGRDGSGGDSFVGSADGGDLYVSVGKGYHDKWAADQDYVASMHPVVALAVADWLDRFADPIYCYGPAEFDHALAIARAYLGAPAGETGD